MCTATTSTLGALQTEADEAVKVVTGKNCYGVGLERLRGILDTINKNLAAFTTTADEYLAAAGAADTTFSSRGGSSLFRGSVLASTDSVKKQFSEAAAKLSTMISGRETLIAQTKIEAATAKTKFDGLVSDFGIYANAVNSSATSIQAALSELETGEARIAQLQLEAFKLLFDVDAINKTLPQLKVQVAADPVLVQVDATLDATQTAASKWHNRLDAVMDKCDAITKQSEAIETALNAATTSMDSANNALVGELRGAMFAVNTSAEFDPLSFEEQQTRAIKGALETLNGRKDSLRVRLDEADLAAQGIDVEGPNGEAATAAVTRVLGVIAETQKSLQAFATRDGVDVDDLVKATRKHITDIKKVIDAAGALVANVNVVWEQKIEEAAKRQAEQERVAAEEAATRAFREKKFEDHVGSVEVRNFLRNYTRVLIYPVSGCTLLQAAMQTLQHQRPIASGEESEAEAEA